MIRPDPHLPDAAAAAIREVVAKRSARPVVIGLCGAQGSGKSTLANALAERLRREGLAGAVLSIDDLYLTRSERMHLAREVHPLLATRGPPGTHDIALGLDVLAALRKGESCRLPRFDKARDDRFPKSKWPTTPAGCAVLVLEGWCVGASPQPAAALQSPVNALEAGEDPHGIWRAYVNNALAGPYRALFGQIEYLICLQAPDFDVVLNWRTQQEDHLRARHGKDGHFMNHAQMVRFIQHYERLTRHMLKDMPDRADMVVSLDVERRADRIVFRADRDRT